MAYLGVDIGGTKTLVAVLDDDGIIKERKKFPTPKEYSEFIKELEHTVAGFTTKQFVATGVALPGRIDRQHGVGIAFGNLPWVSVPVRDDVQKFVHSPVVVENDAKLAGLSEAILLKNEYKRVLYLTISTGIGDGVIINGVIDPELADSEPGNMRLLHDGEMKRWEDFASGRAILERFGKQARNITEEHIWRQIANDLSLGILDLIAVIQPEVVILGGSVGKYFDRYKKFLLEALKKYENALMPIPPIKEAARPEEAVLYGCYELAKETYGNVNS